MSILVTSHFAKSEGLLLSFLSKKKKKNLENAELLPKLKTSYSSSKKSNYKRSSENTVNKSIKKYIFFLLNILQCPGEITLRNKTTCLLHSSLRDKSVVSLPD